MQRLDLIWEGYDFEFTRRWFLSRNAATFTEYVLPEWRGKPIVYLEIGVFEGMSLVWMLQRILTHPEARAVGIDPWLMTTKLSGAVMEAVMQRALSNLEPWIHPLHHNSELWKCRLIRGNSAEVLRLMRRKGYAGIRRGSVDLCMIDGDHNAYGVLDDALVAYDLLKPGGWMLFDDVKQVIPKKQHVEDGLRTFLETDKGKSMQLVFRHRFMEGYRK